MLNLKKNTLKRELISTNDGSKTLLINGLEETYHSNMALCKKRITYLSKMD